MAAADNAANDTKKIEIIRNERKYFSFSIHSLTDEMLKDIRKKYTKYTKNRRQGIRVADELDMPKYRASVIYNSTTEEDKAKLWDNPAVKKGLEAKGICIINALDVIDAVLLPGEKDRIMEIIDDVNGKTLVSASSVELKLENGGNVEAAKTVGTEVAKRALAANIENVVFDRGGYIYTGRVKALADAAREAGLKF